MKVLQINSVCGIRSTGRICTDIADILKMEDHDCMVGYGREYAPDKYRQLAIRIGNSRDVKCHVLMTRMLDNTGHGSKHTTTKFLKWVEEYDPDVIHLHNLHGYYIHLESLFEYLKKSGKPVVWTLHDCWALTGHCTHFEELGCRKWEQGGCYNCPQTKQYPSSIFFDRSKKNFMEKKKWFVGLENMTIVTPSKWLADLVKCSFLQEYPVQVIPNGIDLSVFKPTDRGCFREKYGLQNKKILLGVASVWSKSKGLYDFIQLNKTISDDEVIVLVGLTNQQISSLPKGMIGISHTDSIRELAEIYTSADVFLNPTYEDTYPTVNLEAQACGTPVVTYHTGGSIENVPSEHVVAKGDINELLQKAREAAKTMDVTFFSKDVCYLEYIRLYHRLADR